MKIKIFAATLVFKSILILGLNSQPISLHPENSHYFNFKNKPTVLIASCEHYGSVINPDFDFEKYINALSSLGLNHTRIWLGDYVEKPGDFCMSVNTSAPEPGKFLAPWVRSDEPGFAAGGNKFDLDKWNPEYFDRLHAFMQQCSDRDIVVECVLFFVGPNWRLMPMNPSNNINNTKDIPEQDYMTMNNGNILDYQKKYCLKIINELNKYNNLIFNIANEPWFNNQEHPGFASPPRDETKAWIKEVSTWIVNEETNLPKKHLISIDYTNEGRYITKEEQEKYWKNISIFNHHYDKDAASAKLNYGINKALSFNETGLMPEKTAQYRIQGWKYMLSGGALYNNLDFTFQSGFEDGSGKVEFVCSYYKGCNDPLVKKEMKVLLDFMNSIDFIKTKPNPRAVALAFGDQYVHVLENTGNEYAVYVHGGSNEGRLVLVMEPSEYEITYINPSDGKIIKSEIEGTKTGKLSISLPEYKEDIAFVARIVKQTHVDLPASTEHMLAGIISTETSRNTSSRCLIPNPELVPVFHIYDRI